MRLRGGVAAAAAFGAASPQVGASGGEGPGVMQLTRAAGPKTRGEPTVMALTPALAAAYGTIPGVGRRDPVLLTKMIDPRPAATMRVPTSEVSRKPPLRLTSKTLSYSSSVTLGRSGYSGDMPALLTSTS